MSVEVEQKVVEMQFNNKEFEKGVSSTLDVLERLNQSLRFKNVSKGIDQVNRSARSINLNPISTSLDAISNKVRIQTAAITTTVANLTNTVVNFGKNLTKSLTIDPVKTGLNEYEEKMNSIKVILTNTKRHGTTLDQVSQALDELNVYADKTIYNFQQMTSAIGQFTTQGVPLQRSVNAVKGVANLAAYVGAPASDASRAMFQLSQALSTGVVRLQDWMSLEHTAGMGGKEFQTRLIETARVFGTGVDKAIKKAGNFRESLKENWLTTEVLTATLAQFAGEVDKATLKQQGFTDAQADNIIQLGKSATESATLVRTVSQLTDTMKESVQSGWAQSWEYIVGDLDQASDLLTGISKAFDTISGQNADARNEMLKLWNLGGGRDAVIEGIKYILKGLGPILVATGDTINQVLPPVTGRNLLKGSESFYKMSQNVHLTRKAVKGLINILKVLATPLKVIRASVGLGLDLAGELIGVFGHVLNSLLELASGLDKVNNPFTMFITEADKARMLKAVVTILNGLADGFVYIVDGIDKIGGILGTLNVFNTLMKGIGISSAYSYRFIVRILEGIASFTPEKGLDALRRVADAVRQILKVAEEVPIISFFLEKLQNGGIKVLKIYEHIGDSLINVVKSVGLFGKMIVENGPQKILETWSSFNGKMDSTFGKNSFLGWLSKIAATIPKVLLLMAKSIIESPIGKAFTFLFNLIKKPIETITQMISGIGDGIVESVSKLNVGSVMVMAFSITFMKAITTISKAIENFSNLTRAIGGMFGSLNTLFSTARLELAATAKAYRTSLKSKIILRFAEAIAILTASLAVLTALDMDKLKHSAIVLGGMITVMTVAMMALSNTTNQKDVLSAGTSIALLAASMAAVAGTFKVLENIKIENVLKTIFSLSSVLLAFAGVILLIDKFDKKFDKGSITSFAGLMLSFAIMVSVVTRTMKKLEDINFSTILKSLTTFAAMIGLLRLMGHSMDKVRFSGAIGVFAMLYGISKMIPSLAELGTNIPMLLNAAKASVILTGILKILSIGFRGIGKDLALSGAGFLGLSAAVALLSFAVKSFGNLDPKVFKQGFVAIKYATACFAAIIAISNLTGGAGDNFGKVGAAILGMSMATVVLAFAAQQFAKLDPKELIKVGAIVSEIMGLYALVIAASSLATGSSKAINALSRNLLVLMISLAVLTLIEPEPLLRASSAISLALLGLAAVLAAASKISSRNSLKTVTTLSVIIAGLSALLLYVSKMPNGEQFIKLATGLSEFLLALAVAVRILGNNFKMENTTVGQLAVISAVVLGMYALMNDIAVHSRGEVNLSYIAAIGAMLTIASTNMRILQGMKPLEKGALKNVLSLSAIISGLFVVVSLMSNFSGETSSAIQNAISASILLTAVGGSMRILQDMKSLNKGVLANVLALAGIVSALTLVIGLLDGKDISFETAISSALSVSILLVAISGALILLKDIQTVSVPALGGVAALTAISIGLSYALSLLSNMDAKQILASAGAITLLLAALVGSTGLLTLIAGINPAGLLGIIGAAGMLGIVWGLSEIIKSMASMDVQTAVGITKGLSELIVSLSKATIMIQLANPIGALAGVIAMAAVIAGMGSILAALGWLQENYNINAMLEKGLGTLTLIGESIGAFAGAIIGGFVGTGFETMMPKIGKALSEFAEEASGFFEKTESIDSGSMTGVFEMAKALAALEGINLLKDGGNILKVLGGLPALLDQVFGGGDMTLTDLAKQMAEAGPDFATFAQSVSGIPNIQNTEAVSKVIQTMANTLNSLPGQNGVVERWTGTKSLSVFVDEFPSIALLFDRFIQNLSAIQIPEGQTIETMTSGFIKTMESMVRIADSLPGRDGVVERWTGTKYLDVFVDEFAGIAINLGTYVSNLKKFMPKKTNIPKLTANAVDILWSLVRIQEALPGSNGAAQWWGGNQDLSYFGNGIKSLGKGIGNWYKSMQEVDPGRAKSLVDVIMSIASIASNSPSSGGFFNLLDSDFENFIQNLGEFGEGIADFYDESKDVDINNIKGVSEALFAIANVCKNIGDINPESVDTLSYSLGSLAEANISAFTNPFIGANETIAETITTFANYVKTSIDNQKSEMDSKFRSVANSAIQALDNQYKRLINKGEGFGDRLVAGIGNKKTESSVSKKTIALFKGAFDSLTKSFKTMGKKIGILVESLDAITPKLAKISKSFDHTSKKSDKAGDSIKKTGTKTKNAGKKIYTTVKNTEKGSKAMEELGKQSKQAGDKVKKSGEKSKKAAKNIDKVKKSAEKTGESSEKSSEQVGFLAKVFDEIGKTGGLAEKAKGAISDFASSLSEDNTDEDGVGLGNVFKRVGKYFSEFNPMKDLDIDMDPKDINKKTKKITDKIDDNLSKVTKKSGEKKKNIVKEFRENTRNTLTSIVNPFEEFDDKKAKISMNKMISNLNDQYLEISKWSRNIAKLSKKNSGINKGLLKTLVDMGPTGASYVNTIANSSKKARAKLNRSYIQAMTLSNKTSEKITKSFGKAGLKAAEAFQKGLTGLKVNKKKLANQALKISKEYTYAYQKSYFKQQDKLDKKIDEKNKKTLTKRLNSGKKLTKNQQKIMASYQKYTTNGLATVEKKLEIGQGAVNAFVSSYASNTKDIKDFSKSVNYGSKAVVAYTKKLYQNSEYYKEDNKAYKKAEKAYDKQLKRQKKAEKAYDKAVKKYKKKRTVDNANRVLETQKTLKSEVSATKAARKEMIKATDEMTKHTKQAYKELRDSLKETVNSYLDITNLDVDLGIDLFGDLDKSKISLTRLKNNLGKQLTAYESYQDNITAISSKGFSDGLVRYVKSLGVQGAIYAKALAGATDDQVKDINDLWDRNEKDRAENLKRQQQDRIEQALAYSKGLQKMASMGFSQALIEQLGKAGPDAMDQISTYLAMTPEQVKEFQKGYDKSLSISDEVSDNVISSYAYAGGKSIKGFANAMNKTDVKVTAFKKIAKKADTTMKTGLKTAANNGVDKLTTTLTSESNTKKSRSAGKKIGKEVLSGVISGLNNGAKVVKSAIGLGGVAEESSKKTKKQLRNVGLSSDKSIASGIESGSEEITNSVAGILKNAFIQAITTMEQDAGNPIITPILDLTNIQNGAKDLQSILGTTKLDGVLQAGRIMYNGSESPNTFLTTLVGKFNELRNAIEGSDTGNTEINNNFNITESKNPKETANEVSRVLQRQVERRQAVWE